MEVDYPARQIFGSSIDASPQLVRHSQVVVQVAPALVHNTDTAKTTVDLRFTDP